MLRDVLCVFYLCILVGWILPPGDYRPHCGEFNEFFFFEVREFAENEMIIFLQTEV